MLPPSYPSIDESFARLHGAGWSIGETGGAGVWFVIGTNGEKQIRAEGRSQAEARYRVTLQAKRWGWWRYGNASQAALGSERVSTAKERTALTAEVAQAEAAEKQARK